MSVAMAPLLVAALLLVACREPAEGVQRPATPLPGPAPAPAAQGAACDLVTAEEVSEAAGVPMRVVSPPGATGCSLESEPAGLSIEFMALTRSAVFDQIAAHEAAERMEGIAEDAYFVPLEGSVLAQLHIATQARMLVVTLRSATEGPDLRAIAERFARTVSGRL